MGHIHADMSACCPSVLANAPDPAPRCKLTGTESKSLVAKSSAKEAETSAAWCKSLFARSCLACGQSEPPHQRTRMGIRPYRRRDVGRLLADPSSRRGTAA
jgi:hypothetical protein